MSKERSAVSFQRSASLLSPDRQLGKNRRKLRVPASLVLRVSSGLTLIEVLVAMSISGIFYTAVYGFYRLHVGVLRTEEVRITMQESSRLALDFMVRELRLAGARPVRGTPCDGFERLTVAEAQAVTLQYDFRGNRARDVADGCPDDPNERIAYSYNSQQQTLRRATGGGSPQPVINDVPGDGFLLRYFDRDGHELSSPLDMNARATVRSIVLVVRTSHRSPDPRASEPITSELSSRVFLPNPPR